MDQFIAQVEGGIFDDETERSASNASRAVKGSVRAGPAELGGERGRSGTDEVERVRRQTPESRFNRLYEYMSADTSRGLTVLDGNSGTLYGEVQVRQLVEVDCYVDVPSVSRALAGGGDFMALADVMRRLGGEALDDETAEAVSGIASLGAMMGGDVIATGETDSGALQMAFKLASGGLRASVEDLEGEATVVGRVIGKWPETERYSLLNLPGMSLLNREQRRQLARETTKPGDDGTSLAGPGITLAPVAIFR